MSEELKPGVVYVCPERDIECGSFPRNWCETCPERRAAPPSPSTAEVDELRAAADAVVRRWDSPLWKTESTSELIHRLRAALAAKTAASEKKNPYPHRLEKYAELRKGTGWMQCRCGAKGPVLPDSQCPAAIKEARADAQPSTGEVDVEAERGAMLAADEIQGGDIAAMTEADRWIALAGWLAARRKQSEGGQ